MLTRLVEMLLVNTVNRARQARLAARVRPPSDHPRLSSQDVLLGQWLPLPTPTTFPFMHPAQTTEQSALTLSPEARLRHLYALGSTGCGKTNLLLRLIESDLAARRTFCVIDLRGDLVDRILLRLAHHDDPKQAAQRLHLLDLRQNTHVVGFNPLSGPGDVHSRAFHTLDVLRQQSESWGIQLEETLRNALLALTETGWTLLEIEPLLSHAAFRQQVLSRVSDSSVRAFFARYDTLSEDKQAQWRLPVLNKVTPLLAIPALRLMFSQRQSFAFRPLLDQPGQIILITLAVDRLHHAAHLVGSLLVSAFQTAVMARVDQPEHQRNPVHFYIDEFETMATDRFEAIIAEGRRFGLGLCLSHQNLTQLPPGLRQVVLNNVQTQLYFQTGASDASQLAQEIIAEARRDDIRTALIRQPVGEAFLVRRGQDSVRVRIPLCPDPTAHPSAVPALVRASLAAHGQPWADAEREIAERERAREAPVGPVVTRSKSERAATSRTSSQAETLMEASPSLPALYQVRHGKTTHFKPKEADAHDGPTNDTL